MATEYEKILKEDVTRLIGLFSEAAIIAMVKAIHPSATSTEITCILHPEYKKPAEYLIRGGRGSGKTMAVKKYLNPEDSDEYEETDDDMDWDDEDIGDEESPQSVPDEDAILIAPGEGYQHTRGGAHVENNTDGNMWVYASDLEKGRVRKLASKPDVNYKQLFHDVTFGWVHGHHKKDMALRIAATHPVSFTIARLHINFYGKYYNKFESAYNETGSVYTLAEMFFRPEMRELIARTCSMRNQPSRRVTITDVNKFKETHTS